MLNHHWHTRLSDAVTAAKQQGRPILSLRLLGRLDEELSCANSRFFRTTLYPDARVARMLEERFILHWESVRPVPVITIDFGDGRTFTRTITGNSAHLILDPHGRPVDALPGLFDAPTFVRLASAAADLATADPTPPRLVAWHRTRRESLIRAWGVEIGLHTDDVRRLEAACNDATWAQLAAARADTSLPSDLGQIRSRFPSAKQAGRLAVTKMMVERPLLDLVDQLRPLALSVAEDTVRNEYLLHRRIHERFAANPDSDASLLTDWIYETLFLMPPDDPWLGLNPAAFSGLG